MALNSLQLGGAPGVPTTITTGIGNPVNIPAAPAPKAAPTPTGPWQGAQTYAGLGVTPDAITGPGPLGGPVNGPGDTHTAYPAHPSAPAGQSSNPYASDPGYAAALAAEQLGIGSINQNLNNQIAQRIVQYGDPNLASMAGFGLDPQSAAFARQNYLSGNAELARLDKTHQLQRQAIINRLAGHGLLFSGETGYDTGQEDQTYGNNTYDAQQRVLADILGYRTGALSNTQGLHSQTQQALEQAYQNFINHPELGGYGQPTQPVAQPRATTSTKPPALAKVASGQAAKAATAALKIPRAASGLRRVG